MNLYDRLKPEVKEKIENYKHQAISRMLVNDLKELKTQCYDSISVSNAFDLFNIMGLSVNNINYIDLEKMFEKID